MNKLLALCSATVMLSAVYAGASAVQVDSEQYHVWGSYMVKLEPGGNPNKIAKDNYDLKDSVPVSGKVQYNERRYALSSSDLLRISAAADSPWQWYDGFEGRAMGAAEGDWLFTPNAGYNQLQLQVDFQHLYSSTDIVKVLLEDVTTGNQIFYINQRAMGFYNMVNPYGQGPYINTFTVDPSHQYHVYTSIFASADNDSCWYGSVQITALPEPATLFLLAFGGLALLRKRK
jgi:hypothetical protein